MNSLIGYLINGAQSDKVGLAYDYIMAGNGLSIEAVGQHITARIPIMDAKIRGLPPLKSHILLEHGKIPQRFWDLALSVMLASPETEYYIAIYWDGQRYQLYVPVLQESTPTSVKYPAIENTVVELHSHPGNLGPAFSPVDDKDEQGFKVYGVIGDLSEDRPSVNLRLGVYGYYHPVSWAEIFEGTLSGAIEVIALEEADA